MKKILFIIAALFIANLTFAQQLQKGNLFGVHVITVQLKPNATMEQFTTFFVNQVLPEFEKHWDGLKGYLLKSARGEYKNRFAITWMFKTEAIRNKYFNADDTPNDLEKAAWEKVKPIQKELEKYGTYTVKYMDDWIVQ